MSYTSNISREPEIFVCEMNMNFSIVGSGSYSVVVKPYVENINKLIYSNVPPMNTCVSKIFAPYHKDELMKELRILQKVAQIDGCSDFTVNIIQASTIDKYELKNEVDILQKLKVLNDGKDIEGDFYQLVLEYGGPSLSDLKESSLSLSFTSFLHLINEFYKGIQALQKVGIVHRDIKPTNVLYDGNRLRIIDFGIACEVSDLYANNEDQLYILSYMYMYNPPEFYIASLIYEQLGKTNDFKTSLKRVFDKMAEYSKELETFYYEHYYKYNSSETYNSFAYKTAFKDFYKMIVDNDIKSVEDLFTREIALRSDIYSTSFVLKHLKRYIKFENTTQRQIFSQLFDMTSAINPYKRSNIQQILDFIDQNMFY